MANEKSIEKILQQNSFEFVTGDLDLLYGRTYVRDNGDSFDIIEIVDLDSACGADGQIMVQARVTSFDYVDAKQHKSVQESHDTSSWLPDLARKDKNAARLAYAESIASYGIVDPAGYSASHFVAVFDRSYEKDARERWTSNRVFGWGYAAILRAVENATAACDYRGLPHDISD